MIIFKNSNKTNPMVKHDACTHMFVLQRRFFKQMRHVIGLQKKSSPRTEHNVAPEPSHRYRLMFRFLKKKTKMAIFSDRRAGRKFKPRNKGWKEKRKMITLGTYAGARYSCCQGIVWLCVVTVTQFHSDACFAKFWIVHPVQYRRLAWSPMSTELSIHTGAKKERRKTNKNHVTSGLISIV